TVSDKLYYNISGYDAEGQFANYLNNYISQVGIVPGQAYDRNSSGNPEWSYLTAVVSYTPVKYLNISVGRDKTFIGDGYRSLLLSDYSSPYPFFRLIRPLGNVRYMAMWADMNYSAQTSQY